MDKYAISYKEILSRTVIVEADNIDDAIQKVSTAAFFGDISLGADDNAESETVVSEFANKDGTATEKQLALCWHLD